MNKLQAHSLFTINEIRQARKIMEDARCNQRFPHTELLNTIVIPAMDRINKDTGQENDPAYMAYVLEYAAQ